MTADELVVAHAADAEHQARCFAARWPAADPAALLSDAYLGLLEAARTWDGDGTFLGYARVVMRHRVVDGFRHRNGRRPDTMARRIKQARQLPTDEDGQLVEADPAFHHHEHGFDAVDDADVVARLPWHRLNAGQRAAMAGVARGDLLVEIGAGLGVTESRACQLRGQAVAVLVGQRAPFRRYAAR